MSASVPPLVPVLLLTLSHDRISGIITNPKDEDQSSPFPHGSYDKLQPCPTKTEPATVSSMEAWTRGKQVLTCTGVKGENTWQRLVGTFLGSFSDLIACIRHSLLLLGGRVRGMLGKPSGIKETIVPCFWRYQVLGPHEVFMVIGAPGCSLVLPDGPASCTYAGLSTISSERQH